VILLSSSQAELFVPEIVEGNTDKEQNIFCHSGLLFVHEKILIMNCSKYSGLIVPEIVEGNTDNNHNRFIVTQHHMCLYDYISRTIWK
jgi:hypothetical protein